MSNAPDLTQSNVQGLKTIGRPRKFEPITREFDHVSRPDGGSSVVYAVINGLTASGVPLPDPHLLAQLSDARALSGAIRDFEKHLYLKAERVEIPDVPYAVSRGPVVYADLGSSDVFTLVSVNDDHEVYGVSPDGRSSLVELSESGVAFLIR